MSRIGRAAPARSRGAALLLIFAILGLATVFVLAERLVAVAAQTRHSMAEDESLMQAKEALVGYAATYWDTHPNQVFGFLPCPARDGDGMTELSCGAKGESVVGHFPFRYLEIAALRDSTGNCLWYAVAGAAKYGPKPDELNWDSVGQFIVKDRAGNVLSDPTAADGGPLALVIAPGEPMGTQARTAAATFCGTSPDHAQFIDSTVTLPSAATQSFTNGTVGNAGVNDRVTWITTKDIFDRVSLRSQFKTRIDSLVGAIRDCLESTHAAPADPHDGAFGRVPAYGVACSVALASALSAVDRNMWVNWRSQFHYATCGSPGCVSVTTDSVTDGTNCQGVLLFGGRRTASQAHSTAATRALPRDPLYLDGANAANWTGGSLAFSGASHYDTANPASDIAICIR